MGVTDGAAAAAVGIADDDLLNRQDRGFRFLGRQVAAQSSSRC
jgi:hypothetical protein